MANSFLVTSDSMAPSLKKGDIVEVIVIERFSDVKKGDVIVFEAENRRYVHRLLYIGDLFFLSAGDNNIISDSPMPVSIITGKIKLRKSFRYYFPIFSFFFYSILKRIKKIIKKS